MAQRQRSIPITPTPAASTSTTASTSGHWGDYFDPPLEHNGQLVRGKGFIADDLTDHALDVHRAATAARPFFCYVPFNTPHSPMQVPDRFYEKFEDSRPEAAVSASPEAEDLATRAPRWRCARTSTGTSAACSAKLDELKLADNTIVRLLQRQRPEQLALERRHEGPQGLDRRRRRPRRRCWSAGRAHIRPGTKIPQIAGAIDLLPTLADLAGVPVVGDKPLDGTSLKPLLLGCVQHLARADSSSPFAATG